MPPSRPPGPARTDPEALFCPAYTPGPLGIRDQGDPNVCAEAADSPGALGRNDLSEQICLPDDYFEPGYDPVCIYEDIEDDKEVYSFSEEVLLGYAKTTFGFTGSALDTATLIQVMKEFGVSKNQGQYYYKVIKGKRYIIFKGYAGLRRSLTLPRYLADDLRVTNMMIGTKGMAQSAAKGGAITFILVAAIEIVEYLLSDDELLSDLGVDIFMGMTKTAIASAAGFVAGALAGAVLGTAVAPIAAGILVGIAVGVALDYADQKLGLTTAMREAAKEALKPIQADLQKAKRQWEFLNRSDGAGILWLMNRMAY
ncbi:MAG: hypothetical protein GC160_12330 [Acidobacteria bacterium]|nr:hypothetical protein [Acidobacteriota bacterium]